MAMVVILISVAPVVVITMFILITVLSRTKIIILVIFEVKNKGYEDGNIPIVTVIMIRGLIIMILVIMITFSLLFLW